jgi:translation initiation factor 3 subunit E
MASSSSTSILPKMAPHMSRYMLLPMFEWEHKQAEERGDSESIKKIIEATLALLAPTNMYELQADLHCTMHGLKEPPAEFAQREQALMAQSEKLHADTATLSELLGQDEVLSNLRSDKVANLEYLKNEHGVTVEMVDALYDFGQFQFRCGNYGDAADLLHRFRVLSTDNDKVATCGWGKLACEIMLNAWDGVVEEITKVKETIESRLFNDPRAQLDQRTMLIHWSLFPLFNSDAARDSVLEMLFSPPFINTIQTACPWILRYIVVAVITGRSLVNSNARNNRNASQAHQKQMKDVIRYVRQESHEYVDPVTQFVTALFTSYDFDAARESLRAAEDICRADFFLSHTTDVFVEAARHLICESYCKIYSRINMADLSEKLGLEPEKGEKWIVDLIRDTRMDAKIDSKEGTVLMNHPPNNVYQQVIEKTKGGFFRTQVLTAAVTK